MKIWGRRLGLKEAPPSWVRTWPVPGTEWSPWWGSVGNEGESGSGRTREQRGGLFRFCGSLSDRGRGLDVTKLEWGPSIVRF